MNTPLNSRDIALQSTDPRVLQISANYLVLNASSLQFKYGTDNAAQPAQITVTASLVGKLEGTVQFTTSGFKTAPAVDPTDSNKLIINPDNFIDDFVTINASVNWQGANYAATPVTITRILNQLVAKVQNPIDLIPTYNDGSGYTLPSANNYVELYNGVVKITEGITYGPTAQTSNGLTVSVSSTTGKITLTDAGPNTWTSDTVNFTLTATRNNIVYNTTYTVTKAKAGAGGIQAKQLELYTWSVGVPPLPTGISTYTWTTDTQHYNGSDFWVETPLANPGTVGIGLWKATKNITAEASVVTTQISATWAGATVRAITTESNDVIKTKTVTVYRNATGIPSIAGTSTLTWSSGAFAAPSNWSNTAPAREAGQTLYTAEVFIQAATSEVVSTIDWTQATITPISYYGTDGAAARRAYVLATAAPAGTPASYTATGDALPATGTWFTGKVWSATAPTTIAEGETLYQSDGVYVSASNTTWGYPYISSLKVGNLQAISANTGNLNVSGSIKGGSATNLTTGAGFYVDNNGYLRVGNPAGAQLKYDSNGLTITDSTGASVFTVVGNAQTAAANSAIAAANSASSAVTAANSAATAVINAGSCTWLGDNSVEVITGTQLKRVAHASFPNSAWNSQKYSLESYTNGAYITFIPVTTSYWMMVGLDSNPTQNSSYDTIDYAWYCVGDGSLTIYENGSNVNIGPQTYSINTVLNITYDGKYVKYYKDGTLMRTVEKGSGLKLYADSSFHTVGAEIRGVRFGPVGTLGADGAKGDPGNPGSPGSPGSPGTRGSITAYISGRTSWSDTTANTHFTNNYGGVKVLNDIVTQYGTDFSQTKFWDGDSWEPITAAIDGNLLVKGTVSADRLVAGSVLVGHQIKNSGGTFVIDFGASPYISISV